MQDKWSRGILRWSTKNVCTEYSVVNQMDVAILLLLCDSSLGCGISIIKQEDKQLPAAGLCLCWSAQTFPNSLCTNQQMRALAQSWSVHRAQNSCNLLNLNQSEVTRWDNLQLPCLLTIVFFFLCTCITKSDSQPNMLKSLTATTAIACGNTGREQLVGYQCYNLLFACKGAQKKDWFMLHI